MWRLRRLDGELLDAAIALVHHRRMSTATPRARWAPLLMVIAMSVSATQTFAQSRDSSYDALTQLFTEWRAFETPPLRDGVPDYTAATFARRHAELPSWKARLDAIAPDTWPVAQQVDLRSCARR